jgi:hypothetical protein
MSIITDVFNVFSYDDISISDKLTETVIKLKVKTINIDWKLFVDNLNKLPVLDEYSISFYLSTDCYFNITHFKECSHDISYYIKKSNEIMDLCSVGDTICIDININKIISGGIISIYFYEEFMKWFLKKDNISIIRLFLALFKKNNKLKFICYDKDLTFLTDTISIIKYNKNVEQEVLDRNEILNNSIEICKMSKEINLIPDDFNINTSSDNIAKELYDVFNNIKVILSLMFISDVSEIQDDMLLLTIKGFRNCFYQININEVRYEDKNSYIYKIYKWIYQEGNIHDKSALARNIISIHCRFKGILDIDNNIFDTIKSNYGYYLKQNTDNFLDKKREFILSISEKCNEISETVYEFSKNFKNNFLAVLTYLATLIISNSILNGNFKDIFTEEVTIITFLVIIGSAVFFFTSLIELNGKYKKVINYIEVLKQSYEYIFDIQELQDLIDNNKVYETSIRFYKRNRRITCTLWVVFIVVFIKTLNYLSNFLLIQIIIGALLI